MISTDRCLGKVKSRYIRFWDIITLSDSANDVDWKDAIPPWHTAKWDDRIHVFNIGSRIRPKRSMTAVALLFSIYMIKPSPFCVLDELDAPLDESNINRFVKVLDRFIDRSRFIIITHSKRTMARADVMYGVTMEEFGVSKPVGMRLTASSEDTKIEAKSAAQKAALRLDA